jgi:hypothetical protein
MEQTIVEKNVLNDILEFAKTKDYIIEMIDLFPYDLQGISQKDFLATRSLPRYTEDNKFSHRRA